jgi:cupin 2 domain-containing protein
MKTGHLYHDIPAVLPAEIIDTLAAGNGTRIERIVSRGHCSAPGFWYDQPEHEWVLLLKGSATLRFAADNQLVHLAPGMYVNIPAHQKHRVEATANDEETVWLAVFY